jgi:hypothetical protein
MKLTKSQLKQIIKEELGEALSIGGETYTMGPPHQEDAAFEKLRSIMGLVEKAMLYMTGDEKGGTSPVEVLEMVRSVVSEKLEEKKDHPGKPCKEAHPGREHKEWEDENHQVPT